MEAWGCMTDFSPDAVITERPWLSCVRKLAEDALRWAKPYRKDRLRGSLSELRCRTQLASASDGDLSYKIWLFLPCGVRLLTSGPRRRLRGMGHLLPHNRPRLSTLRRGEGTPPIQALSFDRGPFLLLTIRQREPDSSHEIDEVQQAIKQLERVCQGLTREAIEASFGSVEALEQLWAGLRTRHEQLRAEWQLQQEFAKKLNQLQEQVEQMLRRQETGSVERYHIWMRFLGESDPLRRQLAAIPSQHHRPGLSRELTIAIGLDGMSPRDQRKWRRRMRFEPDPAAPPRPGERPPRLSWIDAFRTAQRQGALRGWDTLYISKLTRIEDVMAQVIASMLRVGMLAWDEIAPWLSAYSGLNPTELLLRLGKCIFPLEANALSPPELPPLRTPNLLTLRDAADELGLTERQVRYMIESGRIPEATQVSGRWMIPRPAVARLKERLAPQLTEEAQRERVIKLRIQAQGGDPQDDTPQEYNRARMWVDRKRHEGKPWDKVEIIIKSSASKERRGRVAERPGNTDAADSEQAGRSRADIETALAYVLDKLHRFDLTVDERDTLLDRKAWLEEQLRIRQGAAQAAADPSSRIGTMTGGQVRGSGHEGTARDSPTPSRV